jgi:superfamily II DNA or RNA helicase
MLYPGMIPAPEGEPLRGFVDAFDQHYSTHVIHDGDAYVPRFQNNRTPKPLGEYLANDPAFVDGKTLFTTMPPQPRSDQQEMLVSKVLRAETPPGVIIAPTGFGKTWVGCSMAFILQVPTLIITTKTDEAENWEHHGRTMLGANVQRWAGDKVPDEDCNFAVGIINSVAKGPTRYPERLYNDQFKLVIFDEVHRVAADMFQQSCWWLSADLRYGLTATPERTDKRDHVFFSHLGPVIAEATGVPMVPSVWWCDLQLPGWPSYLKPEFGKQNAADKFLRSSPHYNSTLALCTTELMKSRSHIVVFSNSRDHLKAIHMALKHKGVPEDQMGYYVGGMQQKQREKSARKRIILATYQMAGQGTNYPWWDACVLGMPIANAKQAIGRVLREHPEKETPFIVDFNMNIPVWKQYAGKRRRMYNEIGAEITPYTLKFDN